MKNTTILTTEQKANKFHRMFNIALYRLNRKIATACAAMPDKIRCNSPIDCVSFPSDVFMDKYDLVSGLFFYELYSAVVGADPANVPNEGIRLYSVKEWSDLILTDTPDRHTYAETMRKFSSKNQLSAAMWGHKGNIQLFSRIYNPDFGANDVLATVYNLGFNTVASIEYLIFYGFYHNLWAKIDAHLCLTSLHARAGKVGWDQVFDETDTDLHNNYINALKMLEEEPMEDYYQDTIFTRVEIPKFNRPIPEGFNW